MSRVVGAVPLGMGAFMPYNRGGVRFRNNGAPGPQPSGIFMATILIVDDHEVVREGMRIALTRDGDLQVVGMASDGRDALRQVGDLRPDIVIMDIAMPTLNGIEATSQIKASFPKTKVVIFTIHSYREFLKPLIQAGISGYVLKQNPISDLCLAVQVVRRGGTYFSEDIGDFLSEQARGLASGRQGQDLFELLTPREREVFHLLAEGLSVAEAAEALSISTKTIETHKYHIMEKLGIDSMTAWIKEAIRRGVVHI
jgi:DNA-binding NarL/FixJ family response regulator